MDKYQKITTLIAIPIAITCILLPLVEFTGVTYDEAVEYINNLDVPMYATRLRVEMLSFTNNRTTVYINNTGCEKAYRPKVKIQHPEGIEFWVIGKELSFKIKDVFERPASLLPKESWNFTLEIRKQNNNNFTCKLLVMEDVLKGWGYNGNCLYGEITHIEIKTITIDKLEFEV